MKVRSFLILNHVKNYLLTDLITYQQLIKKLIYLVCEIRLDIAFIINKLSRHNFDSQIGDICIAKQIF